MKYPNSTKLLSKLPRPPRERILLFRTVALFVPGGVPWKDAEIGRNWNQVGACPGWKRVTAPLHNVWFHCGTELFDF
ncbi:ABC transporter ATP-binding protein [Sesbania bispinosa]|nr:ABC transporter ATP-binding protein [Sesbania bispinosa]